MATHISFRLRRLTNPATGAIIATLATLPALLAGCATGADDRVAVNSGTLIRNVTVVDTRVGSLAPGMAVAVDGGRIRLVVADRKVQAGAGVRQIDGSGQYVVPGFLDMHTHALTMADQPAAPWPLFLANGITGIREMSGSPALIQRAMQINADVAAGRLDAPEILQVPSNLVVGLPSPAAAAGLVAKQKADGASFVKLINASRDASLALLEEAHKQGLGVAGHLPVALPAQQAAAAGWQAIEHLGAGLGVLLDCSREASTIRQAVLGGAGTRAVPGPASVISPMLSRAPDEPLYRRVMSTYDDATCRSLARAFEQHGTWQVPTLFRLRTMLSSDAAAFRTDPHLQYVDKTVVALWRQLAEQAASTIPASAAEAFRAYYEADKRLARLLKDSGVPMLAGSDLGGIWVIPGFGLHQEFRELAAAGFTPLEVLQMTTIDGARFLKRESSMGTVEAGKQADLVLLEADPTLDVANLSRIAGVFLQGRYFSKPVLQAMVGEVARAHAGQPLKELRSALDPNHVH